MKMLLMMFLSFATFSAFADPQFSNLSKSDVENVSKEFGGNFAHTTVSAPETDGTWGVEVGVMGTQTASPDLKDVVASSGGDSKDFKKIYNAAVLARAHFPLDLFAEMTYLPEKTFSDVTVKSSSFGLGWNAGGFFGLPLDLAIGASRGNGDVSFKQDSPVPNTKVSLETKTTVLWLGASKKFFFITPYVKLGTAKLDADLKATGSIFGYTASQKENIKTTGGFFTVGANIDIFFVKLGIEASKVLDAKRVSAKLSFDF